MSTSHGSVGGSIEDPIDETLARRAALEWWGDRVEVRRLPGDVDTNFLATDESGSRTILKFLHPETEDSALELQHAALAHLDAAGVGGAGVGAAGVDAAAVRVPRVVPTTAGAGVGVIEGRRVHRLTWVDGPVLAEVVPARLLASSGTDVFMRSIGRFVGRLDAALYDFDHPEADRTHRWDPLHGGWVVDRTSAIDGAARRGVLERVISCWERKVAPLIDQLPRSVIHADANDHNLLVAADAWERGPVAIVDFGDMVRTARVCEPAIAAAYAAMRSTDPARAIAEVTAGWLEAFEDGADAVGTGGTHPRVATDELALVPTLVRARLAISVTMSAIRAPERPGDAYVTVSEAPAWTLLSALDHLGDDELVRRTLVACGRRSGAAPSTPSAARSEVDLLPRRARRTGPNLALSYEAPIHAVRGWMQYLYDADGSPYLDVYNNVPHVGHAHPHVADAVARQTSLLATNTRYLSQLRLDYLDRLAARFPDPLEVVYLVNSASEANELALRITRAATGRRDVMVQRAGYHGHTTTLVDVSPYKAEGPGGGGLPDWVHRVALPDPYRGPYRSGRDDDPGRRYADDVERAAARLRDEGRAPGALLIEPFPSVGGQIVPPDGYLSGAARAIRAVGGLVVADEVQTGFGRLGAVEWAFETDGVVPDLVVLGKPMGNGFPMAAVVTTRAIAEEFDTGMEFFSTFGGNPVACAAGDAVLDVLDGDDLADRASRVGTHLIERLGSLAERHETIGDVRGMGLFVGIEMVRDRDERTPDAEAARTLVEGLRARGVLAGTDGPDHNVVKMRGPLVLAMADADRVAETVHEVLGGAAAGFEPSAATRG